MKKNGMFLIFTLLMIFLTGSLVVFAQDLVAPLFAQGMKLYTQKDYAGAADYLGQVCDITADHHQARFYLVYSLAAIKNYAEALKQAKLLCDRNPLNPQFVALRDQIQQAFNAANSTKNISITDSAVQKETYLGHNDPLAITTSSGVISISTPRASPVARPKSPLDDAVTCLDSEEYAQAAKLFDAIIGKDPKNAKALHYRGLVEYNQKKYTDARTWFQKAVAVKPEFDTLFLLGEALQREGNPKGAEEAFQKALAIKEDVFAILNLAEAKRKQGKTNEALEFYRKALKIDPNVSEAKIFCGETLLDQGKIEEATKIINEVLTTEPSNGYAHYVKGRILLQGDLSDDAVNEAKSAIIAMPENEFFKIFLAKAYLKGYKTGPALDVAGEIIKTNPNNYEARVILAEGLLFSGEIENAKEHLEQAEKIRPGPEVTKIRAFIARKLGDNEKAKELFQSYLSQEAGNGSAYLEYGQFLEEIGDAPMAAEVYKSIQTRFPKTSFAATADAKLEAIAPKLPQGAGDKTATPDKPKVEPGKVKY